MPNGFAYLMLVLWPVLTVVLFMSMPARRAILWSLLGGFLLLPTRIAIDFPLVPPFDKSTLPSLSILACAILLVRERVALVPRSPVACLLLGVILVSPVFTAITNGDRLVYGDTALPGVTLHDALSTIAMTFIGLIPFLIGRHFFATPESHRTILWAFLLSGLAYSVPMLFEVRMSPMLHTLVYGFFQHEWIQMERFGGYRPIVFMQHALEVALYALLVAGAAVVLWRIADPARRQRLGLCALYLVGVVVLSKTLSVWAYALLLLPLLAFAGARLQIRVAALLAVLVISYPLLRSADLFPAGLLVDTARVIDDQRASSLGSRFSHEGALLEKGLERPLFGWGSWGRARIYDEETGQDITVSDGAWVIRLGDTGLVGFLSYFGLLVLPVLLLWSRARDRMPLESTGLALLFAINLVDLLPNSSLWPVTMLVAGGLFGYAESFAAPALRGRRAARAGAGGPAPPAGTPAETSAATPAERRARRRAGRRAPLTRPPPGPRARPR